MLCGITLYAAGGVRLKALFFVYFRPFSSTSSQDFIKSKNGSIRSRFLRIFSTVFANVLNELQWEIL